MSALNEDFFAFSTHKQRSTKDKYYQVLPKEFNIINKTTKGTGDIPVQDSQDFCLKLSDDSTVEDSEEVCSNNKAKTVNKNDIIVISDSSLDDSNCNSKKVVTPTISKKNRKSLSTPRKYILEISDSSDEDEKFYQAWKSTNKGVTKCNNTDKPILQKNPSFYTSDDSSEDSSKGNSLLNLDRNKNTNISKDTHISSSPTNVQHKDKQCDIQIPSNVLELRKHLNTPTSNLYPLSKSNSNNSCNSNGTNSIKSKNSIPLTRSDLNKILKNIKSTKAVYESPKAKENNTVIDESIDEVIHPALLKDESLMKRYGKRVAIVIDETSSNPEILGNQLSEENVLTPSNIHNECVDALENNQVRELSERKKKEITRWLMTHSAGSQSDSSFTNTAVTSRNSVSSGNSSLERFEMNYETPNNRGKIKSKINEIRTTPLDINKENTKEKRKNEFVHKTNNSVPKFNDIVQKKKSTDQCKNVDAQQSDNANVMECADILDKLYGNVWRDKANILLSTPTEKSNIIKKDRAVQTERKATVRSKHLIKAREIQYKSNTTERLRVKSTSKKQSKYRSSFINDNSESSDSERESLYYTALTTPRTSNDAPRNPVSLSSVKRVIEICDSDTEDDNYSDDREPEVERALDRKRLSFSDDESGSSTSEFDPGDDIPERRVRKADINKTKKILSTPKNNYSIKSVQNKEKSKPNSFLTSLSESVPLSIAHPDARKYRLTYKNNKEDLCKYLYKLYNDKVFDKQLPEDMKIEWNVRMRGTAGYCYNKKSVVHLGGVVRSSRIVLATKILDTPDRLRDTLIHEMCHAAAWLINNISDGHGPVWTAWAKKAMEVFPELPPIRRCHDYKIKTKFTYRCVSCGYSIGRHSKSLDIEKKRCGHCYGKFELLINKTTKSGTVQMQTPKREPSAFALYVKENYSSVKKEKNLKHAEVMKLLGQQFSAVKIGKKNDNKVDNDNDSSR